MRKKREEGGEKVEQEQSGEQSLGEKKKKKLANLHSYQKAKDLQGGRMPGKGVV